jgi:hypothetical protein
VSSPILLLLSIAAAFDHSFVLATLLLLMAGFRLLTS